MIVLDRPYQVKHRAVVASQRVVRVLRHMRAPRAHPQVHHLHLPADHQSELAIYLQQVVRSCGQCQEAPLRLVDLVRSHMLVSN